MTISVHLVGPSHVIAVFFPVRHKNGSVKRRGVGTESAERESDDGEFAACFYRNKISLL